MEIFASWDAYRWVALALTILHPRDGKLTAVGANLGFISVLRVRMPQKSWLVAKQFVPLLGCHIQEGLVDYHRPEKMPWGPEVVGKALKLAGFETEAGWAKAHGYQEGDLAGWVVTGDL